MGSLNIPGPLGARAASPEVDEGTMARTATPTPGPTGADPIAAAGSTQNSPEIRLFDLKGTPAMGVDSQLDWNDVEADFERWEGKVPHMYLDTKGLVTVGIGKMLPNAAAAKALGFVRRSDKAAATAAEIEVDFGAVSKETKGKLAASYKQLTKLDLPDEAISKSLKTIVDGFEADLTKNFAGYTTYPAAAKEALLDMIYNLGLAGLLKFKKLKAAVEARDWKTASGQCHREGPSDERNDWTRDKFLAAK